MKCQQDVSCGEESGRWCFFYLQPKLWLKTNAVFCSWQQRALMISIRKLRLFKGLTKKAYKTEEKQQKLLTAEEGVHGEFKKWRLNYSEKGYIKLCWSPCGKNKQTKMPRTPGFFSLRCIKISSCRKRDAAFLRQKLPKTKIAGSKPKDCCTSEISEINPNLARSKITAINRRFWKPDGLPWDILMRSGALYSPQYHSPFFTMEDEFLEVN